MSTFDPFPHAFTVEEANGLIPELEAAFVELDEHRKALEGHMARIQILDVIWGGGLADPANPDRGEFLEERAAVRRAIHQIEAVVEARIRPLQVRFPPGGLEQGLVDFPTTLDGRWIFLCWKRGEPEILSWHELDGGFQGRRPLSPGEAGRMGGEPREA